MKRLVMTSMCAALVTGAVGCVSTEQAKARPLEPVPAAPAPAAVRLAEKPKGAVTDGGSVSAGPQAPSSPIYFSFDSDVLTSDSQGTLRQMADYLRSKPQAFLTVEGHCDETGSVEYNIALGERRARAARDYLKALGVPESRLRTISYGEERPAEAGNDEAAHARNRRGEFALKGG